MKKLVKQEKTPMEQYRANAFLKIKKRMITVLIAAVAAAAFSGCGKNATDSPGEPAAQTASEISASEADSTSLTETDETAVPGTDETAVSEADETAVSGTDETAVSETDETQAQSEEEHGLLAEAVPPDDDNLVRVQDYIPGILVELKYATSDNFTGEVIYDFTDAYLRYGTVKRLQYVQEEMESRGLTLKIWDAFRPIEAQQVLWDAYPDPTYVSNPDRGYTSHNFGNTVDITVVKENGEEIALPTGFDDFTEKADRDYSDCSSDEIENVLMLENAMEDAGFDGYYGEWWHYQDIDAYPGEDLASVDLSGQ